MLWPPIIESSRMTSSNIVLPYLDASSTPTRTCLWAKPSGSSSNPGSMRTKRLYRSILEYYHLNQERELLKTTDFGEEFIQAYDQFASEYPHAGNLQHSPTYNGLCKKFDRLLNERRKDAATFPYCLFTLYFGNAYFGFNSRLISTAFGTQLIKSWVGTPNFGG